MIGDPHSHGLWEASAPPAPRTSALQGERTAEVAIVGGGFTGLSAALHLAEAGRDVVLLEAVDIGYGGSGRNVGLVNPGLWLAPDEIERRLGAEVGARLNAALGTSPDVVFSLIERLGIACEATRTGTLYLAHSPRAVASIEDRAEQMARRGASVEVLGAEATAEKTGTDVYHAALLDKNAGTVQPLAYARGLARAAIQAGASIHTKSLVTTLTPEGSRWRLTTAEGMVVADQVILATNAYTDALWPGLKSTVVPIHFTQFATEPLSDDLLKHILPERQGTYDTRPVMTSFRLDRAGRLIVGSVGTLEMGGHALMERWSMRTVRRMFPQVGDAQWTHRWSGRFAFTGDHLPRFHKLAENLLTFIAYNGRGIGTGTVCGKALADYLLTGREDALPLPPSPLRPERLRGLKAAGVEVGSRLAHIAQMVT